MSNTYKDAFSKAEYQGREIYKKILTSSAKVKDYLFTPTKYDKVDVITYDGSTSATTELKYRPKYDSTNKLIQEDGALIEKVKWDYLHDTVALSGMSGGYYVMLFNDGVGYSFKVTSMEEPNWTIEQQPKTTAVQGEKIPKLVGKLKLKDGTKFSYK